MQIRPTHWPNEAAALARLYQSAFPDEDLTPLVTDLHRMDASHAISLVTETGGTLTGHILLTPAGDGLALVGPLAVAPDHQRAGLGTALIRAGADAARQNGVAKLLLLGDPAYYQRHGLTTETDIATPYPLPVEWADAWQSRTIGPGPTAQTMTLPEPWMDAALWAG